MFIVLPIAFCTNCCRPSRALFDNSRFNQNKFYDSDSDDYIFRENAKLLNYSSPPNFMYTPSTIERLNVSSETLFDGSLRNPFENEDEELLSKDTDFVIKAMSESYESLTKAVSFIIKIKFK
jgi:hypothetical protein